MAKEEKEKQEITTLDEYMEWAQELTIGDYPNLYLNITRHHAIRSTWNM